MDLLSRHEELVLLSVWQLRDEAYGAAIRNHLMEVTDEEWSIASVYSPLNRLAAKGLLASTQGTPTAERGGRAKRYYRVTAKGVAALNRVRDVQRSMWANLPKLAFE